MTNLDMHGSLRTRFTTSQYYCTSDRLADGVRNSMAVRTEVRIVLTMMLV